MMRRLILWTACPIILVSIAARFGYFPLLFNYTASLPVGIYWKTSDPKAPDIVFCLDQAAGKDAERLGIRYRGSCPDGSMPELKHGYTATPAHPVVFNARGFWVNGKLLPNTAPLNRTPSGKSVHHYPFGVYTSGLWAISDYSPLSFDSRYFGPASEVVTRARPLWTN